MSNTNWFSSFIDAAQRAMTALQALKDWQPLLSGLLIVIAALIIANAVLRAARLRAGGIAENTPKEEADIHADLRTAPDTGGGSVPTRAVDIFQKLDSLRSLIRSALSALTQPDGSENGRGSSAYERIYRLELRHCVLPPDAPKNAAELLESLSQQIETLRLLVEKGASTSKISNILIKLNTNARYVSAALSPSRSAANSQ